MGSNPTSPTNYFFDMSSLSKSTNTTYGFLVLAGIVLSAILYKTDKSGLGTFIVLVGTFGVLIAWGIQFFIDRKVTKQAPPPLTPAQLSRYKIMRVVVALALIGIIIFAVTSD